MCIRDSDMLGALKRAVTDYSDRELWESLSVKAMNQEFGWGHAATEYINLYHRIADK